jgi:putative ABC transport system permease protein
MNPNWKQIVRQHLAVLRLPPEREIEIVEEQALHLEAAYEDALADGLPEAEAEARALRSYDWRLLECELSRAEHPWTARSLRPSLELVERKGGIRMGSFIQDLRFGARMLMKQPGVTLIAVLTLALGIGANTAIFSVVNAVLLQPLPFQEPERLARIWRSSAEDERGACSYPDFADLRARQTVFERMAAWRGGDYTLTGKGEPVTLRGVVVTADLFPLLGAAPQLGRSFTPAEDQAGNRAAILSHSLWRQRFNADPNVLGQSININSLSYDVVGVMPAGFAFPVQNAAVDLWLSLSTAAVAQGGAPLTVQRGSLSFSVIARLKPNVSAAQAEAGLRVIVDELAKQYPESKDFIRARVVPFHQEVVRDVRPGLLLLFGAVGCVLLIACANVATLLLARATTRHKEMAIRAALGSGRWRIVRQLLTESMLLALCGGAAGWLLARWGTVALLALKPGGLPRALAAGVDARALGFTVLAALATGVLFGLAPAWHAARTDLNEALKDGGKGGGDSAGRNRFRHALVVAEVALAFVLLVCSGLLLNSFLRLRRVNPGFDPHNVLTFRIALPASRYAQLTQVAPFYRRLIAQLETLPGVKSVSAISHLPLSANRGTTGFSIEGVATAPDDPVPYPTDIRFVTPGYFQTMGMQLVKGRDFNARDELRATEVAIINEALARRYFPNQDPLGKRIRPGYGIDERGWLMREIVGVASDSKHVSLREAPPPNIYLPHSQIPRTTMTLVVRAANDPHGLIGAVQNEVHALDREAPVFNINTLDEYMGAAVAEPKFDTMLLGLFAGLALLLTSVGLYGVMAYIVAQRTREFGIRMALGARSRDVLRLVIKQGMGLALFGAAIGIAGALALTRAMKSWLFGVGPTDPLTFAAVALMLAGVALLACYIPARRATKVDPLVALRHD